jgi:hypothetical protein
MLEQMNDTATSFEKVADMEHKSLKMKIMSTTQQVHFYYGRVIPQVCMNGVVTAAESLTRIPTYADWGYHDVVGGLKNEITFLLEQHVIASATNAGARFYEASHVETKNVALALVTGVYLGVELFCV